MSIDRDTAAISLERANDKKAVNDAIERQSAETKKYLEHKKFEEKRFEDLILLIILEHAIFIKYLNDTIQLKLALLDQELRDAREGKPKTREIADIQAEKERVEAAKLEAVALAEQIKTLKEQMAAKIQSAEDAFNKVKNELEKKADELLKDFSKMTATEFKAHVENELKEINVKLQTNSEQISRLDGLIKNHETAQQEAESKLDDLNKRIAAIKNELLDPQIDPTKTKELEKELGKLKEERGKIENVIAKGNSELSSLQAERAGLLGDNQKLSAEHAKLHNFLNDPTLLDQYQKSLSDKLQDQMKPSTASVAPSHEGTKDTAAYCAARDKDPSNPDEAKQNVGNTQSSLRRLRMDLVFADAVKAVNKDFGLSDSIGDRFAKAQAGRLDDFNAGIRQIHSDLDGARAQANAARYDAVRQFEPQLARLGVQLGEPELPGIMADGIRGQHAAERLEEMKQQHAQKQQPEMPSPPPIVAGLQDQAPQHAIPADAPPSYASAVESQQVVPPLPEPGDSSPTYVETVTNPPPPAYSEEKTTPPPTRGGIITDPTRPEPESAPPSYAQSQHEAAQESKSEGGPSHSFGKAGGSNGGN